MIWILIFWLQIPENYTEYWQQYRSELECRDSAELWNRRFRLVGSQLRAECREKTP